MFYRRVRPRGPGWGPVAAGAGVPRIEGSLAHDLLNAVLRCVLVYAALFGVGQMLLRSVPVGVALLGVAAAAGFLLARDLSRHGL